MAEWARAVLSVACVVVIFGGCRKTSPEPRAIAQPSLLGETLSSLESSSPATREEGWQRLTTLLNQKSVRTEQVRPESARLARLLGASLDRVAPFQRPGAATCGSFVARDDYQLPRNEAELLLDLAALADPPAVAGELGRALKLADPRLRYFALLATLRQRSTVDAAMVQEIAADDDTRNELYRALAETGQAALFPAALRTQEALARSTMVHWLTYPTELGCAPDEIRLMQKIAVGDYDTFVFAFRVRKPKADHLKGWLAGVAGPYLRADEPTVADQGGTFSDFAPADSKTAEAHAARIRDLLDRAARLRAETGNSKVKP